MACASCWLYINGDGPVEWVGTTPLSPCESPPCRKGLAYTTEHIRTGERKSGWALLPSQSDKLRDTADLEAIGVRATTHSNFTTLRDVLVLCNTGTLLFPPGPTHGHDNECTRGATIAGVCDDVGIYITPERICNKGADRPRQVMIYLATRNLWSL